MDQPESELNRAQEAAPETPDYKVGHGKPPIEHRFKKGKSANPGGKPKVKPATSALPQLPAGSLHEMLMLEARRPVRVKAGDRMVEIPAIQAAFRALGMKAARGNRVAVATLAQLLMRSEATQGVGDATGNGGLTYADILEAAYQRSCLPASDAPLKAAEEYKTVWTAVLTGAAALGAEIAEPAPHPDEVTIGQVRGTVHWPGAEPGETLSLDRLAATHAELRDELPLRRAGVEAMKEGYDQAVAWGRWFAQDDVRKLIEKHLPARYADQIAPDTRSGEEAMRDRQLRSMAEYDRERHERIGAPDAARGVLTGVNGSMANAEPAMPLVELAQDPAQTVAEATIYRDAWLEVLEAAEGMEVKFAMPVPHPEDVTIDAETQRVTYRVAPAAGERATLDNLRGGLARLQEEVARHRHEAAFATQERFAVAARRRRDEMLALCGVIEGWLAGVEDG